jgi:glycosyltransferase involved in cell wall biosynthesis
MARSFVRYVDASSLVDEITEEVLNVERGVIPAAYDPDNKAPLERVSLGESVNQVEAVAKNFIELFPELSYASPRGERMKPPEKAGIIEAIKLYFKWVYGWLRKQPKQLLQGFIQKKKAELAGKVQSLYGGENSKIAVYVGNVTTHGGQDWNSFDVTRSIQEAGSRLSTVKLAPAPPGMIWQTFFKAATACVLPYREIDQSGVLATALAFETPLVTSQAGGLSEAADRGAAISVPVGDVDSLHDALVMVMTDKERQQRLSAAAHELAHGDWSWKRAAQKHMALYERLINES